MELRVPVVQVLSGHLAGKERSVPRERLAPSVLGEFAVQLAGSAPTEQVVHLARAQLVLRVRFAVLERREPSAQVLPRRSVG